MIEFKSYASEKCFKCGKDVPIRFFTWCAGGIKLCSYQCFKTHQPKKFFYCGHGMQVKERIKRATYRLLYRINLIRLLRDWDGTTYWGY